jgi:hypothetical protein
LASPFLLAKQTKGNEKMHKKSTLLVLFLTLTICLTLIPLQPARNVGYKYPTWCYCVVSNDVIGVGQTQKIIFWINSVPPTANGQYGDRWKFTVDIIKPDGTNQTIGPVTSDSVGSGYTMYTPTEPGNYTAVVKFPTTVITGLPFKPGVPDAQQQGYASINDTYLASVSDPTPFVVQEDPIPLWPETPLPSAYWTRPINSANIYWYTLAGNWLDMVGTFGGNNNAQTNGPTTNFGYGLAPESAHIMWSTPGFAGGIMDERFNDYTYVTSHYGGLSFQPVVLNGKIYYNAINRQMNEGWYCLALYTGKQLYFHNTTGPVTGVGGGMFDGYGGITQEALSFAQIYDPELDNQMGGYPYLWSMTAATPNTWMMFDAYTGSYICSINNVPTGTNFFGMTSAWGTGVYGKDGSILRYNIVGTPGPSPFAPAGPPFYLQCWNTTQAIWWKGTQQMYQNGDYSGFSGNNYASWRPYLNYTYDGSHAYSLNVSLPWASSSGSIQTIREGKYIIGGSPGSNNEDGTTKGYLWALNLDPSKGALGSLLWNVTFTPPSSAGNKTVSMGTVDPEDGVFLFSCTQTRTRWGYSLETGQQIWESEPEEPMKYYGMSNTNIYKGRLYSGTYLNGGILVCYNITTGEVLWKYEPKQIGTESPFGDFPAQIACISDDKIFIYSSPLWRTQPLWRGSYVRCINATDGTEIWKILHYGDVVVADGYAIGLNYYDNKIYCYGKGPSQLTVTAPDAGVDFGKSVVIHGSVIDISAGTTQTEQAARFPNGVPCVSDESQEAWMEFVYEQQSEPTNVTGVPVEIDVLDSNNNYRNIGTAYTDASGFYSLNWIPDIPGKYTVYAHFEGSRSYWPSTSQTAFAIDEVTTQPTQQPITMAPQSDAYLIVGAAAAVIIAVAIVGALILLALRKRP